MEKESWHLDKKVPVAIIATLILQAGAFVWWAAGLDIRTNEQERRIVRIESWQDGAQLKLSEINEQLSRLDERMLSQLNTLRDINDTIKNMSKGRR